eukprot:1158579-Pelagomonas_calceolata.AAC.3
MPGRYTGSCGARLEGWLTTCHIHMHRECGQEPLQSYWFRAAVREFAVYLHTRLCRVWNDLDSVEPRGHSHKRTTSHCWFASPLNPVSAEAAPYKAPIYLGFGKTCSKTFLILG